ncbi:MAG: hypothetical protein OXT72_09435 [Gammaproteobacteria bacterium]|nr:hypothetical protein [Gammaproteobacteria bacterium]MDE0247247.1 hypothetical protein [Gammaproteobacteria bacterium]
MTLSTERTRTLDESRACLAGNAASDLFPPDRDAASALMGRTPVQFRRHFGQLPGPAIDRILWRECHLFGGELYLRLSETASGHIYNLRAPRAYRQARTTFSATRAVSSEIGQRRKIRPEGQSGFVRFDTFRGGGRNGEKGAYDIDVVDEVTQFQEFAAVPRITGYFMVPVFEALVGAFPFRVLGFHADNGSDTPTIVAR